MMKYVWVSNAGVVNWHREWSRVWVGVSLVFVLVYVGFGMIWISLGVSEIVGSVLLVWVLLGIGHLGTVICGSVLSSGWGILGGYRNLIVWIGYDLVLLLGWVALGTGVTDDTMSLGLEGVLHAVSSGVGLLGWLVVLAWSLGMIMEGGRIPFDMGECESELVSGYVTEYGALGYGLLASAEYGVVVLGSVLWCRLIFGCVGMTALFIGVLFVWVALMIVRLTLPRVRVSDGVLWLSYGVLVPGIVSTLVVIANVRSTRRQAVEGSVLGSVSVVVSINSMVVDMLLLSRLGSLSKRFGYGHMVSLVIGLTVGTNGLVVKSGLVGSRSLFGIRCLLGLKPTFGLGVASNGAISGSALGYEGRVVIRSVSVFRLGKELQDVVSLTYSVSLVRKLSANVMYNDVLVSNVRSVRGGT